MAGLSINWRTSGNERSYKEHQIDDLQDKSTIRIALCMTWGSNKKLKRRARLAMKLAGFSKKEMDGENVFAPYDD